MFWGVSRFQVPSSQPRVADVGAIGPAAGWGLEVGFGLLLAEIWVFVVGGLPKKGGWRTRTWAAKCELDPLLSVVHARVS